MVDASQGWSACPCSFPQYFRAERRNFSCSNSQLGGYQKHTAIGCDSRGWRHVLGISAVDTEPYGSWLAFLQGLRARGIAGTVLVISDAHEGLKRAIQEAFQGAARQRCAVHLMRDCIRAASGSRTLARRVARIVAPVFRAKDAAAVRALNHVAADMLRECCPKAADIWEDAEADALAYPGFPTPHWKRLETSSVQERASRETRRRTRVVQVFPSVKPLERLVGAVMCGQDEIWADSRHFSGERCPSSMKGTKRHGSRTRKSGKGSA